MYQAHLQVSSSLCGMPALKDETDTLSRNAGNELPTHAVQHPRTDRASITLQHKRESYLLHFLCLLKIFLQNLNFGNSVTVLPHQ
jgi:hypothetical protein